MSSITYTHSRSAPPPMETVWSVTIGRRTLIIGLAVYPAGAELVAMTENPGDGVVVAGLNGLLAEMSNSMTDEKTRTEAP